MTSESETKEQILTKYLNSIGENTSFFNCALEAMQEYSSIQVKAVKQVLREEFLLNTQNYPREYHALFEEKFNRAMKEFESLNTK